jgi:hypothetical protein
MDDELLHDIAVVFTDLRFSAGMELGPLGVHALKRALRKLDDGETYLRRWAVQETMESRLRELLCPPPAA